MKQKYSLRRFTNDDRGQILLLAAIAIVILLFGIITILNTAAFTEHQRSSGVDERTTNTIQTLENIEYSIETAIRHANHNTTLDDNNERKDRLISEDGENGDIDMIEKRINERLGSEGIQAIVDADSTTVNTDGVRIWKPGFSNLSKPDTQDENYDLVNGADNVRSFTITVTGDNVTEPNGGVFTVEFDNYEEVYIYEDPSEDEVVVSDTSTEGGQTYAVETGDPIRISFTHGKLNDKRIPILPATEDITRISFNNTGNIDARMDLIAENPDTTGIDIEGSPSENPDGLEAHSAVYSVTTETTIQTPESNLTTVVRITPQLPGYADTGA